MNDLKLYYLLLGCTPAGRHTEQHDVFFCIGESLSAIKNDIAAFWPDAGRIHIDAWREVTNVDGYEVIISEQSEAKAKAENLFFINLGGYLPGSFEEHHYKLLAVAKDMSGAIKAAKRTKFYVDYNTEDKNGVSHVDNKYGVDVDEIFNVKDILPAAQKPKYSIQLFKKEELPEDELHIGYFKWSDI